MKNFTRRERMLFSAILLVALLGLIIRPQPPKPATRLKLGSAAAAGQVLISLAPPRQLNGLTKKRVYELRALRVNEHQELLSSSYHPFDPVFSLIEDGAPWWADKGMFMLSFDKHPGGEAAISGPSSYHSAYLENPFLLLAPYCGQLVNLTKRPEFAGLPYQDRNFPYICTPKSLTWEPQRRHARAVYDISDYLRRMEQLGFGRPDLSQSENIVSLMTYNAQDFGFSFMQTDSSSTGIDWAFEEGNPPIKLIQFFHRGGSCGYPGGCNNMSPSMPYFKLTAYPAALRFNLWYDPPSHSPPDFTFEIVLQ